MTSAAAESEMVLLVPEIDHLIGQAVATNADSFQLDEWIRAYLRRLPIMESNKDLRALGNRTGVNWTAIAQGAVEMRRT